MISHVYDLMRSSNDFDDITGTSDSDLFSCYGFYPSFYEFPPDSDGYGYGSCASMDGDGMDDSSYDEYTIFVYLDE